jgi:DNA-binding GntR family transcriptional regulator
VADEIYDLIKAKIVAQEFAPGQRLNLEEIEKQLGISRTPLKDALNKLAGEGLVEIVPRKGTFVSNPTPEEIAESFDVRRVLEMYAAELALPRIEPKHLSRMREMVQKLGEMVQSEDWVSIYQDYVALDHDLHHFIVELSGNKRLLWVYEQMNVHVQMARIRYLRAEQELDMAQMEHEEILRAFEARDGAAAREALAHHIERAKRSLLRDLERCETQMGRMDIANGPYSWLRNPQHETRWTA